MFVGGPDLLHGSEKISELCHCPVMCFLCAEMRSACVHMITKSIKGEFFAHAKGGRQRRDVRRPRERKFVKEIGHLSFLRRARMTTSHAMGLYHTVNLGMFT